MSERNVIASYFTRSKDTGSTFSLMSVAHSFRGQVPYTISFTVTVVSPTALRFLVLFAEAIHLDVTMTRVGDATPFANPLGSRLPDSGHSCNFDAAALPTQQVRPWVLPGDPVPRVACPLARANAGVIIQKQARVSNGPHKPGDAVCVVIQPYMNMTMSWVVPSLDATHISITVTISASQVDNGFGTYVAVGFPSAFPYAVPHTCLQTVGWRVPAHHVSD